MNSKFKRINNLLKSEIDPAFKRRAKIILSELNLNKNILDLGCGRGFYLQAIAQLKPKAKVVGVDIQQEYLKQAQENIDNNKIKLVQANASNLPFKDNQFDQIIASEILEHINKDQQVINEIYRVLKPKGIVLISVPNKNYPFLWDPLNWILEHLFNTHLPSNIWWLAGIWADHVRLYDKKELIQKFIKAGLKIEKHWQTTRYSLPFAHFLFYGLGKNLVEAGFCSSCNRFSKQTKQSLLNKLIIKIIRVFDQPNEGKKDFKKSVNIIVKAKKIA